MLYLSNQSINVRYNFNMGKANLVYDIYDSIATVGEIRVWWRADFQSGSRVLKKVF